MSVAPLTDPDLPPAPPEPARWTPALHGWVLSLHADVQAALRDRGLGTPDPCGDLARVSARTGCPYPHVETALAGTMLFQTGERHAASRDAVRRMLAVAAQRWTARTLREAADAIVAALGEDVTLDAATGLADRLPLAVLGDMLGAPPARIRALGARSRQLAAIWRPMPPLREYARLERLHELPCPGLDDPPDAALAGLVPFLALAGVDTTGSAIAAGLDLLARMPALQAELRGRPARIAGFVGETLRLAGPVRRLRHRVATAACRFGGVEVPAGAALLLQIDRAHRDPAAYPGPDRLDLARRGPPLAAFGGGGHVCQGGALGQAQVAAMLAAVLARFEIAPAAGRRALLDSAVLRQFESLPLRLRALPGRRAR